MAIGDDGISAAQKVQRRVSIVPHTHWDREWYEPFQTFRLRLVHLIDALLDLLESDPSYSRFLLDGQMAVVDDYLEIRPENEERIRALAGGRAAVDGALVHPDGRVPGLGRDDHPGPADGAAAGGGLRRGHGGRLPPRHVRAHRPDAPDPAAGRLRARGGVAGGPVGDRQDRLLVGGTRRVDGAGRVPADRVRQRCRHPRRRQGARPADRRPREGDRRASSSTVCCS